MSAIVSFYRGETTDPSGRKIERIWSFDHDEVGYNYRLDEPRAALALSRMRRLDADIESRRELARTYRRVDPGGSLRSLDIRKYSKRSPDERSDIRDLLPL